MIVGSGLLARAFKRYADTENVIIFASGVADSGETRESEFSREKYLLDNTLEKLSSELFVYFGSCSIFDPETALSPYAQHKSRMELMVQSRPGPYFIFRLPQVVGPGGNRRNLVNFMHAAILSGKHFSVWTGTVRYLIDIDDVVSIASDLIDRRTLNQRVYNIAFQAYHPIEIVRALEECTGKRANLDLVNKGQFYKIDTNNLTEVIARLGIQLDNDYLKKTIRKYYSPVSQ